MLVGEAMKAVLADPLRIIMLGKREVIRERSVVAMKSCIEAGDLRQFGSVGQQRLDRREVVRLMKRGERHVTLELFDDLPVHDDGAIEGWAAVNHAMAGRQKRQPLRLEPPTIYLYRRWQGGDFVESVSLIRHVSGGRETRAQALPDSDSVVLPFDQALQ